MLKLAGASLSTVVPGAVAPPGAMATPLGGLRVTVNVSVGSASASPTTWTVSVVVVWPAAKVTVPLAGVTSGMPVPEPLAVVNGTVSGSGENGDRVTVKLAG